MKRQTIRCAAVLVAVLATVGFGVAPVWAAPGVDLAALSLDGRRGAVGATVRVPVGIANKGDDLLGLKQVVVTYRAPAGTVIVRPFEPGLCQIDATGANARCQLGPQWRAAIAAKKAGAYQNLELKVVGKVTAPGAFTVSCQCDTKKANNTTDLVVNGVTKPLPSASPKPSAPVQPSPSAKPSATPSASPSTDAAATDEPVAESTGGAVAGGPPVPDRDGGGSLSSGIRLIGFGIVLLGLVGLGGAVYLWRVRSGGDDEDDDMDATQVLG